MLKITVSVNVSKALEKFAATRDQVPFATALALTKTAQFTKEALRQGMTRSFVSVTNYTKNSLAVTAANKRELTAYINVRGDDAGAIKWLRPEVYGGKRQFALEALLQKAGLPPPGMYAIPGKFAKLSGGHVDIGWVANLVAAILVNGQSGITISMTKRRNVRKGGSEQYFVLKAAWGKLLPGIYGKRGSGVYPYIVFVRQPSYAKRYDFFGIAKVAATNQFPIEFDLAIKKAMATKR